MCTLVVGACFSLFALMLRFLFYSGKNSLIQTRWILATNHLDRVSVIESVSPMMTDQQNKSNPSIPPQGDVEHSRGDSPVLKQSEPTQLTDQAIRLPRRKIISVFLACCLTDVCVLLDYTSLAIALPAISSALNAGTSGSWISGAYFLTSSSCQLLYSHLSDVWSRKQVLLVLLGVFFLASLASSVAKTATQLIIFRAFAGIGGGGLITVAQVIVSDVVSLRERGKYQGILGAAVAISNGIGPLLGASFAHGNRWRWIFRINMPLAALCALATIFFMPLKKVSGNWKRKLCQIDFLGSFLTLSSSSCLILAFNWAGVEFGWSSIQVYLPLAFSALSAGLFVFWEWRFASIPVMPLRIYKSSIVCGVLLTQSVNGWVSLSTTFYLPQFYQLAYGYSPLKSAFLLIPITVIQTFTSTLGGLIISWAGDYRIVILSGWAIWTIGLGLISTLNESSNLGRQLAYSMLTGFGIGGTFQASLIAIQGAVDRRDAAVVTAARGFFRNLFATIGLSISGTIVNNAVMRSLEREGFEKELISEILDSPSAARSRLVNEGIRFGQLIAAYRNAFRIVFLLSTGLAAISFLCALFFIKAKSVDRPEEEAAIQQEGSKDLLKRKGADQKRKHVKFPVKLMRLSKH